MAGKNRLSEALNRAAMQAQTQMHSCLPGTVLSYDHTTQKAQVVSSIRAVFGDGKIEEPQVINNVPVVFPRSGGASLTMPVKRGDGVMLVFADRSTDEWRSDGGTTTPDDPRMHDISDCFAVVGLYPFTEQSPQDNNDDTLLQYGGSEVRLKPGGVLEITTAASVTVNTPAATINSTTENNGDVTINGNLNVSGVTTTGGLTSQGINGAASMSGGVTNTGGEISSNGISLDSHTHGGVEAGGSSTGGPQ